MDVKLRPVVDVAGCHDFQMLERLTWGSPDAEIVPVHVLITLAKNGGVMLGAYAEDGPLETHGMVGGALWWLGAGRHPQRGENQLKVCSHMVGVLPEWQGQRIGLRLKLEQRRMVLEQGLTDWITWTYDPLYRANAVFNIHRLGATCNTYVRNLYGELQDRLNRGAPTDRCQVDWLLNGKHVLSELNGQRVQPTWNANQLRLLPAEIDRFGAERPVDVELTLDGAPLAVPIPSDIAQMRRTDGELSLAWRFYLRRCLEDAFAAGYTLVDCAQVGGELWRYILLPASTLVGRNQPS